MGDQAHHEVAMSDKPSVILVDIDGTIALRGDRDPYDASKAMEDAVNWPVVEVIYALMREYGHRVQLLTGRDEQDRDVTEYWLRAHRLDGGFWHPPLFMRSRGDVRSDEIVKEEIYRTHIEPHYTVFCVFDDRDRVVQMWRRIGLTCLQVAEGNF